MLKDKELEEITRGLEDTELLLELVFGPGEEESPFGARLLEIARQIETASKGKASVRVEPEANLVDRPGLTLRAGAVGNVHYMALPEGPEAQPFAEKILSMARGTATPKQEWEKSLAGFTRPAEILVFIAPTCPHCPQAVREAGKLAGMSASVDVSIIDIHEFPTLTEQFAVRSVPLTVLDRGLSRTGVVPASELAEQIIAREGEAYEGAVFLSLVENGRFDEAARLVLDGRGLRHFLSTWRTSTTQLRIGLMLVVDEVLEADDSALNEIVSGLLDSLSAEDAALRGDTADLLGRIGDPAVIEALEKLKDDPNPDVAEIAEEAIEEIRERDQT